MDGISLDSVIPPNLQKITPASVRWLLIVAAVLTISQILVNWFGHSKNNDVWIVCPTSTEANKEQGVMSVGNASSTVAVNQRGNTYNICNVKMNMLNKLEQLEHSTVGNFLVDNVGHLITVMSGTGARAGEPDQKRRRGD